MRNIEELFYVNGNKKKNIIAIIIGQVTIYDSVVQFNRKRIIKKL